MIEVAIKPDIKFCKLDIEIYYSNFDSKGKFYKKYASYYYRKLSINRQTNKSFKIISIKLNLSL